MKIKINKVADINANSFTAREDMSELIYIDTSSVTEGHFSEFQKIRLGKDLIPSRAKRGVKNNTIIISTVRPNLHHYAILINPKVNTVVSTGFVTIDAKEDKIDPQYLYYALCSDNVQKYLESIAATATSSYPSFTPSDLGEYAIEVPDNKDIQKSVTKLLRNIDIKISLNNSICSDLEAMAKLIYDYWFVQFNFPDENGRPYKSSGGKMVWNEELKREIPAGWEVKTIGSILDQYPKTIPLKTEEYDTNGKYPIVDQSKKFICGYTDNEKVILEIDDCVVFGDHTNFSKYVNFNFARGADGTQIIVSNNINLSNYLLYLQILDLPMIEQGYSRHFKFLKEQYVIVPSFTINKAYKELVSDGLNKIKNLLFVNKELASLRDFLLPMLMNGQVKVGSEK